MCVCHLHCTGHTALDKPMLYGALPITKAVAGGLGAVIAVLGVAVVGLAVGWRLSVTRNRKSYKKWNEEVRTLSGKMQIEIVVLDLQFGSTNQSGDHSAEMLKCCQCNRM